MKSIDRESALLIAIQAAQQAGTLLRKNLRAVKRSMTLNSTISSWSWMSAAKS